MPLAAVVDTIESVPEALRGEYTEQNGKFYLNIEGVDNHHAVGGLKTALQKERDANKGLKDLKAKYESLGLSHEEIADLISKNEAAAAEALRKKGDVEGILKQHQTKWDTERSTLVTERDQARNLMQSALVKSEINQALSKSKATPEGLALLPRILSERVQLTIVDGEPVHKIMSADGKTPMVGSGSDGLATYDDFMKEVIKSYPSLFEGSGAAGSGAPRKGGSGGGDKVMTRADFDVLTPPEKSKRMKEGWKVVD